MDLAESSTLRTQPVFILGFAFFLSCPSGKVLNDRA